MVEQRKHRMDAGIDWKTLVSVADLAAALEHPQLRLVDCRFDLTDPQAGRRAYHQSHLPGALYAHLDEDLSGELTSQTGRHPLPSTRQMEETFGRWGIGPETQVVAYDDRGGVMASRLWWMLRTSGHARVAVLDGGWPAWVEAGGPVSSEPVDVAPVVYRASHQPGAQVGLEEVLDAPLLIDSRGATRYAGREEPLDPVAGHIPGALNRHYADNLDAAGRFHSAEQLRREFEALLGDTPPQEVAFYCGSGVSACHNLLAMTHAGLATPRLYVGSWSQWCRLRPDQVARSED